MNNANAKNPKLAAKLRINGITVWYSWVAQRREINSF
jgi:hypothetical protein